MFLSAGRTLTSGDMADLEGPAAEDTFVRLEYLDPSRFEEACETFVHLWLAQNPLWQIARISAPVMRDYVYRSLFERAKRQPHSAVVAIDTRWRSSGPALVERVSPDQVWPARNADLCHDNSTPPLTLPCKARLNATSKSGGAIVSLSFGCDWLDPIESDSKGSDEPNDYRRCPNFRRLMRYWDYTMRPFVDNPLFEHLKRPGVILNGLMAGTLPAFVNRLDSAGRSLSARLMNYSTVSWIERGYSCVVARYSHAETIARLHAMVSGADTGGLRTLIFSRVPLAGWTDVDGSKPFAALAEPTHVVCAFTMLPNFSATAVARL